MTNTQHTRSTPTTKTRTKRRPSVALVLAFVALLTALSNGAYAVAIAEKNSVTSKSIKNGTVKAADLAPKSVGTAKLKGNAVTSPKVVDGGIHGADLANGAVGAAHLGTIQTVTSDSPATADADGINNGGAHGIAEATATCPADSVAIGGGATWLNGILVNDDKNNYLQESYRTTNGWRAKGIVDFGAQGTVKLRTYAYCLMPTVP